MEWWFSRLTVHLYSLRTPGMLVKLITIVSMSIISIKKFKDYSDNCKTLLIITVLQPFRGKRYYYNG